MSDKVTENEAPDGPEIEAGEDDAGIAIEVEPPDAEPEAPADPIAVLEARVAALELDKKETFDRLLRATADLDNYRKRARRDVDDARIAGKGGVLTEMLPVVDNLERALQHSESATESAGIVEGVKLVLRQFLQALERCDVTPLEALGQAFDPNLHEAVGQLETDDYPPGAVCQELQRGYKIGDRLLRPALIVVAKAPVEPEAEVGPNGHDREEAAAMSDAEEPPAPSDDGETDSDPEAGAE
jgi:molecular chaperone GrpE